MNLVYNKVEKKNYAMKKIKKSIIWGSEKNIGAEKETSDFRPKVLRSEHKINEIEIMLNLHNPYVIHLHEIIEDPAEKYIYIILHLYSGGDCSD